MISDVEQAQLEALIDNLDPPSEREDAEYIAFEQNAFNLIQKNSALLGLHSPEDNDVTPLIASVMSANRCCSVALFKSLLKSPTDVNAVKEHGLSAIHFLAIYNRHEHMQMLLKAKKLKVDVNARTQTGDTAVYLAAFYGASQTLALLINEGQAQVNTVHKEALSPLHAACFFGQPNGGKRETPITQLQAQQYLECIELLLSAGASVNVRDKYGSTPVHCLASADIPAEIKLSALILLIEHGADLTLKANNKNSAMVMAKTYEFTDFSKTLQKRVIPPLHMLAAKKMLEKQIEDTSSLENISSLVNKLKLGKGIIK